MIGNLTSLLNMEGSTFLVNWIIEAYLQEEVCIQWYGTATLFHKRNRGTKQRSTISSRLWSLVGLYKKLRSATET